MSQSPDFGSEYAKSDRSQCKLCKHCISMGSLRLSIYVQSPFFDGKVPNWYHFNCFFKKATVTDTCFIKGFESLRWEDQQKINQKLGLGGASAIDNEQADDNSKAEFLIEYSKSNRSKCKKCEKRIDKDVLRISANKSNQDGWYHLECFAKSKSQLNFKMKPQELTNFESLNEEDKKMVEKEIGEPEPSALKRKHEVKEEEESSESGEAKKAKSEQVEKEAKLKIQSQEYWKLRDALDKELTNDVIKELLEENDQKLNKMGRDDSLNFLADMMLFGPTEVCSECKNGQLVFKGIAYYCHGNITEWTKCSFKTQNPKRKNNLNISEELREEFPFLKKFKFKQHERIFSKSLEEFAAEKKEKTVNPNANKPLFNMNFSAHGKLSRKNDEIKTILTRLGGRLITSLNNLTIALITNEVEVEKMNKKLRDAVNLDIHVISENFLDEISNNIKLDELINLIQKHSIHSCGSDLKTRIDLCVNSNDKIKGDQLEAKYAIKSLGDDSRKIKMKVKGGAVVDPESELQDEAHVLCELRTNDPYSCVLGFVDIIQGTNSYYKLQIIEHDSMKKSWGRVGTTIGGNKLASFSNKDDVLHEFKVLYLDKTGNEWDERKTSTKKANKFYPLEMDYGENDDEESEVKNKISDANFISKSSLAKPIQNIIKLIFDIETMKQQMKEFEIDLNKMPLGKISSKQIKMAFNILNDLTNYIDQKSNQSLIVDASNQFYTLIPHDFGMKKPTILNDPKIIQEKTDMLNSLLDIEIAYNILKTDGENSKEADPIDIHYKKLNCEMEVLDHNSDEFKFIVKYVNNTHASTHSYYKLVIEDVFKVHRPTDSSKYEAYKTLHNRKLLWHGSRTTNFAGILSQGLRIAPPEAPCTGYMFGKGVYFADMVSKSANYCFASSTNPTGLLLLCEVALGDMYEKTGAEYVTKLPKGKHSTKGCGRTEPSPKEKHFTPDGVEIPYGQGKDSGVVGSSLLYNEYIVYDTAQINMKYLLRVNFIYD